MIDSYEQVVETDLEAMARDMGLVPARTAAVIDRDQDSAKYGLVVRVEMEVQRQDEKGKDGDEKGYAVQAVNPVSPVEPVNVAVRESKEDREPETGNSEESVSREETLEQLRQKVEEYYGLEAGKVEIKFQGR